MPDFTKLWDKSYLFGPNPVDLSRSDLIFFWAALLFVLIGTVSKIFASRQARPSPRYQLFNRFYYLFFTMGILILLWVGARFENIPWLSTHIIVLFLFFVALVWLVILVKYFIREYQNQQKSWEAESLKQKYLTEK